MAFLLAICLTMCGLVYIGQWWVAEPDGYVDGKASIVDPPG